MVQTTLSDAEARFDRRRRAAGRWLAPVVLLGLLAWPMPGLSPQAHTLAGVAAMTVVLWVTEAIPLAAAALLGPSLAVLLGVAEAKAALAAFGDPLIFLFLGGFLLASGLGRQGIDRRAALWLVSRRFVGGSPVRALYAVGGFGFVCSMWISNTATTAMLIPVVLGLHQTMVSVAPDDPATRRALERFGGAMCLALAYASSMGGSTTPIGTAPNVIAVGMLDDQTGVAIDFGTWMSIAMPGAAVMTVVVLVFLVRTFPAPMTRVEGLTAEVQRRLEALGPLRPGERRMLLVFGLAVVGWLLPAALKLTLGAQHPWALGAKATLNEGVVAVTAACLLFVIPSGEPDPNGEPPRLLHWEDAQAIDWGTLLLLGGGFALGKLTFQTGLAEAIGRGVLDIAGPVAEHPAGLLAMGVLLVIFLTELTSNTATTSMMLPVIIGIASASGIDPISTAVSVTLAASYAFMMPVSTPPNAMAYGTGLVRLDDMVRVGLRLNLVGLVVVVVVGLALLPVILG
ncbi:MAG: DASS family sodium-coupled anion symporter [Myxococcota bacterium]